jgi:hypothetical protein
LTPQRAGKYLIAGAARMDNITSGNICSLHIYKNGAAHFALSRITSSAAVQHQMSGSGIVHFNGTTDYAELFVWHNVGADRSLIGNSTDAWFSGMYLGA